jgi:hypothetical protein
MNVLRIGELSETLILLRRILCDLKNKRATEGGDSALTQDGVAQLRQLSDFCRPFFIGIGFDRVLERLDAFDEGISSDPTLARMQSEIENLSGEIVRELKRRWFFYADPDRSHLLTDDPFGDIVKKFPSAADDIEQAAYCLAMDLPLASIFHLMRIAEVGLRALAKDRRVIFKAAIELQSWEEVIRGLEDAEVKIQSYPKTPARERQFTFYHEALMELKRFKNVWRNRIMHTRNDPVDRHQAYSTFTHVKAFMEILAREISETSPPTPEIWVEVEGEVRFSR